MNGVKLKSDSGPPTKHPIATNKGAQTLKLGTRCHGSSKSMASPARQYADLRWHSDATEAVVAVPSSAQVTRATRGQEEFCQFPYSVFAMTDPIARTGLCIGLTGKTLANCYERGNVSVCTKAFGEVMNGDSATGTHQVHRPSVQGGCGGPATPAPILRAYLMEKVVYCNSGQCSVRRRARARVMRRARACV